MLEFEPCQTFYLHRDKCCGLHHEQECERIANFTVEVETDDGKVIQARPWIIRDFYIEPGLDRWVSLRLENPEVSNSLFLDTLTLESREKLLNYLHPNTITTPMTQRCPYRRTKIKKLP